MQRRCIDCGNDFTIAETEAEFYAFARLHLPRRCKTCRALRRERAS
jgi:hypothetical protein